MSKTKRHQPRRKTSEVERILPESIEKNNNGQLGQFMEEEFDDILKKIKRSRARRNNP